MVVRISEPMPPEEIAQKARSCHNVAAQRVAMRNLGTVLVLVHAQRTPTPVDREDNAHLSTSQPLNAGREPTDAAEKVDKAKLPRTRTSLSRTTVRFAVGCALSRNGAGRLHGTLALG